jgi:hypothetical protein
MYSEDDLDAAVAAGVMSAETAAAFRAHVAGSRHTPAADEEQFRLITGFNDIFVVIASVLLLASVGWIGATIRDWLGALAIAAAAWALAEFFVRRRRMALPAIVLLLAFVGSVFMVCLPVIGERGGGFGISGAIAAAAAWLHWLRFRVPITVAAGAAAMVGGAVGTLMVTVPAAREWLHFALFASGLAVFAIALRWDASDVRRETRRSDVAFWLHLLAAPLLVHPVFTWIGMLSGEETVFAALLVFALYIVIALVSLAIDRRALMVSALSYVLYAFSALLQQTGFVSLGFALTALVIGSALLLLSAFWQKSRAAALGLLPPPARARLAPLR